jgi:hypothetical protein
MTSIAWTPAVVTGLARPSVATPVYLVIKLDTVLSRFPYYKVTSSSVPSTATSSSLTPSPSP